MDNLDQNLPKKKISIGLDIGTTSVGWAIVDEDCNLVDYGVRLFEDSCEEKTGHPKNEARRKHRCQRRLLRRKKHRKEQLIKLLVQYNICSTPQEVKQILEKTIQLPWEVKIKGLTHELNKEEIVYVLYHYLSHRGFSYIVNEESSINENDNDKNIEIHKSKDFPSIQQKIFFDKHQYQSINLNQQFSIWDWEKEIKEIFIHQPKLPTEFKEKYLKDIFFSIRDFSIGPGSEKSPTKYGLYYFDNKTNKVVKKGENLWDSLVGACSWYPNEHRASAGSASAIIFNLLNDLQNLRNMDNDKWRISKQQKKDIFEYLFANDKKSIKLTLKILQKKLGFKNISGYRVERKISKKIGVEYKPLFTDVSNIKNSINFLNIDYKNFDPCNFNHLESINKLVEIKCNCKNIKKLHDKFYSFFPNLKKSDDEIVNFFSKSNIKKSNDHHQYSIKALNEFIFKLFNDEKGNNWSNFSCLIKYDTSLDNKNKNQKIINLNDFDKKFVTQQIILPPTVKRSTRQAFKIINAILTSKNYKNYEVKNVCIEMCRENNSYEKQKNIEDSNALNEFQNKQIEELIGDRNCTNKTKLKLILAKSQNWCDPYDDFKKIDPNSIINNPNQYQIDHIIPISFFHNDSRSNKVLTSRRNNQEKGDRTPYQWFKDSGKLNKWFDFKQNCIQNIKMSLGDLSQKDNDKINNLCYEKNPYEDSDFLEMNSRKLVDTSYSTSIVLDTLQKFFKNNSCYPNDVNVLTIKGALTNYIRKKLFKDLHKNREDYRHHAVDAMIIALFGLLPNTMIKLFNYAIKISIDKSKNQKEGISKFVDEKISLDKHFENTFKSKIKELIKYIKIHNPKFSRMVSSKMNKQFFDETNYSYKKDNDNNITILTKTNIFDSKIVKKNSIFESKTNGTTLDDNVFFKLKEIYDTYNIKDVSNPFVKYMEENFSECKSDLKQKKYKYLIYFDDNNQKQKIANVKIKSSGGNINDYFVDSKNNSLHTGINFLGLDCYYHEKKWKIIPLTMINCYFMSSFSKKNLNKNFSIFEKNNLFKNNSAKKILRKNLYFDTINNLKLNVIDHYKFTLFKGQTFIKKSTGEIFYFVGYSSKRSQPIELKPINYEVKHYIKHYLKLKTTQITYTINNFFNDFKLCYLDILGNKYFN